MKIERNLYVSNVRIKPDNFRKIASLIMNEYHKDLSLKPEHHIDFDIELETNNEIKYQNSDLSIFDIMKDHIIIKVYINYGSWRDRRIYVRLYHSHNDFNSSSITISGNDEKWVNGITKSMEDIIGTWEKQPTWPKKYERRLGFLFAVFMSLLLLAIIRFFFQFVPTNKLTSIFGYLTFYFFVIGIIIFLNVGSRLSIKISKLFPGVEFITGEDYQNALIRKRKQLSQLFIMGIFPFVIAIIIEILKFFIFYKQ